MSFDLARALRRIKPQRRTGALVRRSLQELPAIQPPASAGPELLLDTCVYIDALQGRTPAAVDQLLTVRIVNHSTICLSEMTHLFGRLDPMHANTKQVLDEVRSTIQDMPDHRIASPSGMTMGEAGMLAGLVARLLGSNPSDGRALLNDACLYLQALERGWTILTRNARDFDCFDQLLPAGRVLFYAREP